MKYDMTFSEAQEYCSKRGIDTPWNDGEIGIGRDRGIIQTVGNVLKWADAHPKNPWVSVQERLPKEGQMILAKHRYTGYYAGFEYIPNQTTIVPSNSRRNIAPAL